MPTGQHISVACVKDGKEILRSYTPVSSDSVDRGYFELLVKTYEKGNVSLYLDQMKIGDLIRIKGPRGQMRYKPYLCKEIAMLAGGSGITPMMQIIRAILRHPKDFTKISLIYANVNEDDILLRDELDQWCARFPNLLRVYHVLNNPPPNWNGGSGFITTDVIKEHCPAPGKDVKMLLCGPPPMVSAMKKNLSQLGWEAPRPVSKLQDQVFVF